MNKGQLIDDIRQLNATAQTQFLEQFDEDALKQYLEHLQFAREKRTRYENFMPAATSKVKMVS